MHLFLLQGRCLVNGLILIVPFVRAHQVSFQIPSMFVVIVGEERVIGPGILINLILHDLDLHQSKVLKSLTVIHRYRLGTSNFLET